MLLESKTILITGSSSGIGREIAKLVAEAGGKVVLTGRNELKLKETYTSLPGEGHYYLSCDLTNQEQLEKLVNELNKLDGIVFCAGVNQFVPVKFISEEKVKTIFDVNYFSSIFLIQKLVKRKKINKSASMVFISSISSLMGVPATMLYSASKAAVNSTVKVLATELAGQKIRVNAVCPGIVKTPMLNDTNISEEQFLEQEKFYPLGLGNPEDVANAVIFHLSDKSRWLTGNIMILDGGFSLQ